VPTDDQDVEWEPVATYRIKLGDQIKTHCGWCVVYGLDHRGNGDVGVWAGPDKPFTFRGSATVMRRTVKESQ
jgi:hypothetical protein